MNLARQFAAVGQAATAVFDEEQVTNLDTGAVFGAKIVPVTDLALRAELGLDPRASDMFYVRDPAALIHANHVLSALGAKYKVLPAKAPKNPAVLHREFQCMVLTGKDGQA